MGTDYESYITAEWEMFTGDPARALASLEAVQQWDVSRVLDVGCGAGQEMLPFAASGAFCVGLDLAPEVGSLGRILFSRESLAQRVAFLRSAAERLPFRSNTFDVLICRLALPYTDNRLAITEMARVLRQGGRLLLRIHHARYYVDEFWRRGLLSGHILHMVHAARVLTSGALYHFTGRQFRNRLVTNETFQSRYRLDREAARCGFTIIREMPDSTAAAPSFLMEKTRG
ncbi:MAG: Methyltransferase type 11 [Bryobacterales bacterium]|nr:Methyltransferase type 11 [Bryobacterales bacterium]